MSKKDKNHIILCAFVIVLWVAALIFDKLVIIPMIGNTYRIPMGHMIIAFTAWPAIWMCAGIILGKLIPFGESMYAHRRTFIIVGAVICAAVVLNAVFSSGLIAAYPPALRSAALLIYKFAFIMLVPVLLLGIGSARQDA